MYHELQQELQAFYAILDEKAFVFNEKCSQRLEESFDERASSYQQKALQYQTIAELCQPVLFKNCRY